MGRRQRRGPTLQPRAFARRFAPTPGSIRTTSARLAALGFTVEGSSASGLLLEVAAPARTFEAALSTTVVVTRRGGRASLELQGAPTIPASLAGRIVGVVLDGGEAPTAGITSVAVAPRTSTHPTVPTACPSAVNGSANAADLAAAYGLSTLPIAGGLGAGTSVAVQEVAQYSASDLATFDACYAISPSLTVENSPLGGAPALGGSMQTEATADLEVLEELVPGAHVVDYASPDSTAGILASFDQFVADDTVPVLSTSWGFCEASLSGSTSFLQAENTEFQLAALQGQTVLAASGDVGSSCGAQANAVSDPASQPFVTAVGGTALTSYGPPPVETGWSGSGGGVSSLWSAPCFEAGVSGSTAPCTTTNAGTGQTPYLGLGTTMRSLPDLAALAGSPGYTIYDTPHCLGWCGTTVGLGGTSLATPLVAAIVVAAVERCGRVGLVAPVLDAAKTATLSNDVTAGSNGAFAAGVGWDAVTGVGSPKAGALVDALCAATPSTAGAGTLQVLPTSVEAGATTTLTFTYTAPTTGVADGSLVVVVPSGWSPPTTNPGVGHVAASAGVVSVVGRVVTVTGFTVAGGATVTVTYGDGALGVVAPSTGRTSTFSASESPSALNPTPLAASPSVAVTLVPSSTSLAASPGTVVAGSTVTLTATVHPSTATGTVAFSAGGAPIAGCSTVALVAGVATCTTTGLAVGSTTVAASYDGDATVAASSGSTSVSVAAPPTATTTTVSVAPSTATVGTAVTVHATIDPDPRGGTVAFTDGATTIAGCGAVAVIEATASCTTSSLAIGSHTVTATFTGSTGFLASSSSIGVTVRATPASSAVTLTASPTTVVVGAPVTLVAAVTPVPTGGTVAFTLGSTPVSGCTAVVLVAGTATCVTVNLPLGTTTVTARYSGDADQTAASASTTATGIRHTATVSVAATPTVAWSPTGTTVVAVVQVTPVDPAALPSVQVSLDGVVVCAHLTPTPAGRSSCSLVVHGIGAHRVAATSTGAGTVAAGVGAATVTVVRASPTLLVAVAERRSGGTVTATLRFTLHPSDGHSSVTVRRGSAVLRGCGGVAISPSGTASCVWTGVLAAAAVVTAQSTGTADLAPTTATATLKP